MKFSCGRSLHGSVQTAQSEAVIEYPGHSNVTVHEDEVMPIECGNEVGLW